MSYSQILFMTESGDASDVSIHDVNQGSLGDCYLCSTLAALAYYHPAEIKNIVQDNGNNTDTVRLYQATSAGTWVTQQIGPGVTEDVFLPVFTSKTYTVNNGTLQSLGGINSGGQLTINGVQEVWPQAIENAFAQQNGGYSAIASGGSTVSSMEELTGSLAYSIGMNRYTDPTTAQLTQDIGAGDIICFDTGGSPGGSYGLLAGHSYTFTGITTSSGVDYANFRNPWGYDNPAPIPVSDLYNAFFQMDVGLCTSAPIAGLATVAVVENTPIALGIAAPSDLNYAASALTITATGLPGNGTVTLANGTAVTSGETLTLTQLAGLLFTPTHGLFDASGSFTYSVADPDGNTSQGANTLAIGHAVGNPSVSSPTVSVVENTPVALGIAAPTDPNYATSALTITATGLPSNGTVTLANGTAVTSGETLTLTQLAGLLFTPTHGLFGASSSFTYSVADPDGNTSQGATTLAISSSTSGGTSSTPTPAPAVGQDQIGIVLSEDAYQGDAEVSIAIDGQTVDPDLTLTALHGVGNYWNASDSGQTQTFTANVTDAATHSIVVTFLNDKYDGTPSTDRNAYVDNITVNGNSTGSAAALMSAGQATFTVLGTPPSASGSTIPPAISGGLVLNVAEDAWQGNAQFTVSVNGHQVGSTYTTTASNSAGQSQAITLPTTLSSSMQTIGITFLNDAYGGTASTDRNLYLDSATLNGVTVSGRETLLSDGTATFNVNASDPTPVVTSSLVLNVSEDAWQGDAQMVVSVDGQTMGNYTATASHPAGQSQAITINDLPESFSPHDIAVSFINDAYGGSSSMDRNLYVNSVEFDGRAVAGGSAALMSDSTQHFTASAPANWTG